jgi:hypothetical protein
MPTMIGYCERKFVNKKLLYFIFYFIVNVYAQGDTFIEGSSYKFMSCDEIILVSNIYVSQQQKYTADTVNYVINNDLSLTTKGLSFTPGFTINLIFDTYIKSTAPIIPVKIFKQGSQLVWETTLKPVYTSNDRQDAVRYVFDFIISEKLWGDIFSESGFYTIEAGKSSNLPESFCFADARTWILADYQKSDP